MSQFNDTSDRVPALPSGMQAASGINLSSRESGFLRHFAAHVGQVFTSRETKPRSTPTLLLGGAIAMRSLVRGFCSLILAVACGGVFVGSADASWYWPWGSDQPKQATPLATAPPLNQPKPASTAGSSGTSVLHPSTWHAPSMPWSSTAKTNTPPAPNKWAQTQPKKEYPSPWQTVKNGTRHAENATANAWHKTVGVLTPVSSEPKQQVAQQKPQPSWWSRMTGPAEEEKPDGARTVGEFMAQKRLEP
jgi:hypothetical protein